MTQAQIQQVGGQHFGLMGGNTVAGRPVVNAQSGVVGEQAQASVTNPPFLQNPSVNNNAPLRLPSPIVGQNTGCDNAPNTQPQSAVAYQQQQQFLLGSQHGNLNSSPSGGSYANVAGGNQLASAANNPATLNLINQTAANPQQRQLHSAILQQVASGNKIVVQGQHFFQMSPNGIMTPLNISAMNTVGAQVNAPFGNTPGQQQGHSAGGGNPQLLLHQYQQQGLNVSQQQQQQLCTPTVAPSLQSIPASTQALNTPSTVTPAHQRQNTNERVQTSGQQQYNANNMGGVNNANATVSGNCSTVSNSNSSSVGTANASGQGNNTTVSGAALQGSGKHQQYSTADSFGDGLEWRKDAATYQNQQRLQNSSSFASNNYDMSGNNQYRKQMKFPGNNNRGTLGSNQSNMNFDNPGIQSNPRTNQPSMGSMGVAQQGQSNNSWQQGSSAGMSANTGNVQSGAGAPNSARQQGSSGAMNTRGGYSGNDGYGSGDVYNTNDTMCAGVYGSVQHGNPNATNTGVLKGGNMSNTCVGVGIRTTANGGAAVNNMGMNPGTGGYGNNSHSTGNQGLRNNASTIGSGSAASNNPSGAANSAQQQNTYTSANKGCSNANGQGGYGTNMLTIPGQARQQYGGDMSSNAAEHWGCGNGQQASSSSSSKYSGYEQQGQNPNSTYSTGMQGGKMNNAAAQYSAPGVTNSTYQHGAVSNIQTSNKGARMNSTGQQSSNDWNDNCYGTDSTAYGSSGRHGERAKWHDDYGIYETSGRNPGNYPGTKQHTNADDTTYVNATSNNQYPQQENLQNVTTNSYTGVGPVQSGGVVSGVRRKSGTNDSSNKGSNQGYSQSLNPHADSKNSYCSSWDRSPRTNANLDQWGSVSSHTGASSSTTIFYEMIRKH